MKNILFHFAIYGFQFDYASHNRFFFIGNTDNLDWKDSLAFNIYQGVRNCKGQLKKLIQFSLDYLKL